MGSSWLANVVVVLVSVGVVIVVSEVVIYFFIPVSYHYWVFNDAVHHTFVPNMTRVVAQVPYVDYSVEIVTDSHGFRSDEFSFEKPRGVKRVLVLGDSMTASVAVNAENMFTAVLSERLNNNSRGAWEVINRGIEDWGTDNEFLYFVHEGYRYKPDIVLLQFSFNDFSDVFLKRVSFVQNNSLVFANGFPENSVVRKFLLFLNGRSGLYRLTAMAYQHFFAEKAKHFLFFSEGSFGDFDEAFNETVLLVSELNKQVQAHGARFMVVILPDHRLVNQEHYDFWNGTVYGNFLPQKDLSRPFELIKKRLEKDAIKYVDVSQDVKDTGDYIAFNDGHLSVQGSKIAGERMYAKMIELGWT